MIISLHNDNKYLGIQSLPPVFYITEHEAPLHLVIVQIQLQF